MKCYNHGDIEAVGVCTSCGKAVCSQCDVIINNKIMCKSCVSDALDKKSSAPNLFNQIVRYLDLIIGSAIVCLLAFFTIFFFLMGASGAGYLGILFCAAAAIGLYYDYKRKKYSTGYSVLTIVLYGVLLVIVIAGIFAIAAFIL